MSTMAAGEKRIKHIDDLLPKASIVLVDIEGTTTSISFVKDTLFPYIRSNLESYLKAHWNDAEFQDDLLLLKKQAKQDESDKVEGVVVIPENDEGDTMEAVARNVLWQMDLDRKTKALKQLQGHIMREGYEKGTLKGHVYSDVVPALKSWVHSGRQIYIYSSGSVEAQKLLFGHSEEGDLLELFAGHFDTSVGPKVECASYMNIVKKLECRSEDVLFLTDIPREAKAAEEAGLQGVLVVREGNEPLTEEDKMHFPVIRSFQDVVFEASAKRKKMSTDDEPHVTVESPTNETSDSSNKDKVKTGHKTEVANPESAGSGNGGSSLREFEMMDVSNNDRHETNVKTDRTETESQSTDIKMAVEDGDTKECGKTELATNGSEVSKTRSSPPELKTVEAADTENESPKPCSKTAEENDSGKVSETMDVKLKSAEVDVEVSKVATDVELNDTKIQHEEPARDVASTKAGSTDVDNSEIPANVEEAKVDAEKAGNTGSNIHDKNIELTAARNGSGSRSAIVDSKKLEMGSGDPKTSFVDSTAGADAGDTGGNVGAKAGCSHEEVNLQGREADTENTKVDDTRVEENSNTEMSEVDVDSTETKGKTGADSSEIKNYADGNAGDAKVAEIMNTDDMTIQMKAAGTGGMEMESLAKLGEQDEALKKTVNEKSGENASVKEEGKSSEVSEGSSVNKEGEVSKLQSEVTDKTGSDVTLHQLPEKHTANDSSADNCASRDNKSVERTEAILSMSTAELNTELPAAHASREESSSELKSAAAADKILQVKMEDRSNTVENSDSGFPVTACNVETAEADANTNEDIKPVESKNEEEKGADESSAIEDTTKENGLAATAEDCKDVDISNNCPDSEQNGEVSDAERDVKVKKHSVDGSGDKDDATPIKGVAST